jgi:hypothetical protein
MNPFMDVLRCPHARDIRWLRSCFVVGMTQPNLPPAHDPEQKPEQPPVEDPDPKPAPHQPTPNDPPPPPLPKMPIEDPRIF